MLNATSPQIELGRVIDDGDRDGYTAIRVDGYTAHTVDDAGGRPDRFAAKPQSRKAV